VTKRETTIPWASWKEAERKWDEDVVERRIRAAWKLALKEQAKFKGKKNHRPRWMTLGVPNYSGSNIPLAFAPLPKAVPPPPSSSASPSPTSAPPSKEQSRVPVPPRWRRVRDVGIDHGLVRHYIAKHDRMNGWNRDYTERGRPWEVDVSEEGGSNVGGENESMTLRGLSDMLAYLARKGFRVHAWIGSEPPHGQWEPRSLPSISGFVRGDVRREWALPICVHKASEGELPVTWWRYVYGRLMEGDLGTVAQHLGCQVDSCRRLLPLTYLVLKRIHSAHRLSDQQQGCESDLERMDDIAGAYQAVLARFVFTEHKNAEGGPTGGKVPGSGDLPAEATAGC
jgi:hypothetical protein